MKKLTLTQRLVILERWADEMEDRILSNREKHLMDRVLRITDSRDLTEADVRGIVYDVFTTTRKARLRRLGRGLVYTAIAAAGTWGVWILVKLIGAIIK